VRCHVNVAIDGPSAAGKSTVAQILARKCGLRHIDTGAMYRAVTLEGLRRGFGREEFSDEELLSTLAQSLRFSFRPRSDGVMCLYLNEEDVSDNIRSPEVERWVSAVARVSGVRRALVAEQRRMAAEGGAVMDGRDIGTWVLPDAPVKVFLTADVGTRISRRLEQQRDRGVHLDWQGAAESVIQRDEIDSSRAIAPLRPAEEAVIIDTTHLTVEETVEAVKKLIDNCPCDQGRGRGGSCSIAQSERR